jgi:tetratricopeptide (TPR) repeat protein
MKYIFLPFFSLIVLSFLSQCNIDSLNYKLNDTNLTVEEQSELLYQKCQVYYLSDNTDEYLSSYKEFREFAEAESFKKGIILSSNIHLMYLFANDKTEEYDQLFNATLALFRTDSVKFSALMSKIYLNHGTRQSWEESLPWLKSAYELTMHQNDRNEVFVYASAYLENLVVMEKYHEAIKVYNEHKSLGRLNSSALEQYTYYSSVGDAYFYLNQDSEAVVHYLLSFGIAKSNDLQEQEVESANYLGLTYWHLDESKESEKFFKHGVMKGEKIDSRIELANLLYDFGDCQSYDENEACVENLNKAKALYLELDDSLGIVNTNIVLSDYYLNQSQFEKSIESSLENLKLINGDVDYTYEIAYAYFNNGEVFYRQQKYQEAYDEYIQAYDLLKELTDYELQAGLNYQLGMCLKHLGNFTNATIIFKYLVSDSVNIPSGVSLGYAGLGNVALSKKDYLGANDFYKSGLNSNVASSIAENSEFYNYQGLMLVYYLTGDLLKAIDNGYEAEYLIEFIDNDFEKFNFLLNFSAVYVDSGNYEEGLALLYRAEKLISLKNDSIMLGQLYSKIIECVELSGDKSVKKKYQKLNKELD